MCAGLEAGLSVEAACSAAGLDKTTHYDWIKRGKDDEARGLDTVWREYSNATFRARLAYEASRIRIVTDAAQGLVELREEVTVDPDGGTTTKRVQIKRPDWRAAAWQLERSFPDRWGPKSMVAVTAVDAKTWNIPGLVLPGVGEAQAQLPVETGAPADNAQPEDAAPANPDSTQG